MTVQARHPDDPEPVRASKARAVWWLGLLALVTGPLVGGVVLATVALLLAGQFRREAYPAGGVVTGAGMGGGGERMAGFGIALAGTVVGAGVGVGAFQVAGAPPGTDFGPQVD